MSGLGRESTHSGLNWKGPWAISFIQYSVNIYCQAGCSVHWRCNSECVKIPAFMEFTFQWEVRDSEQDKLVNYRAF